MQIQRSVILDRASKKNNAPHRPGLVRCKTRNSNTRELTHKNVRFYKKLFDIKKKMYDFMRDGTSTLRCENII